MVTKVSFTYFANSHDRDGRPVTATWENIAQRLCVHREGDKDGPAIAAAMFSGTRSRANLIMRTLVALDIETSKATGAVPPDPQVIVDLLTQKHLASVLWTTHSHTPADPRYRVVMPLSAPLDCAELGEAEPFIAASAAAQLGLCDVCDTSKYGASSLFYLARHPAGSPFKAHILEGEPIDAGQLRAVAIMVAQNEAMTAAEKAAHRARASLPPEVAETIRTFNEQHDLREMFTRYGYVREGGRWKSPFQTVTSQGATTILPGGLIWATFSESDAQMGLGARPAKASSQCGAWGDCFSLYTFYEHHGNFRNALAAIRETSDAT